MHKRKILTRSFVAFMDNDLTTSAAAASYFSMLVLFPMLLLLITIGNYVLGPQTVERYLVSQVLGFLPGAQSFIRKNLESISNISTGLIISCLIVVLWAASWLFTVIEKALNRVWGTSPRSFLHGRAVNMAVMTLVWALLGASAIFTTLVTGLRAAAERLPLQLGPELAWLAGLAWQVIFIIISVAVTIILFTVLYKFLPNTRVVLTEALVGATIAGVLWEGAKFGFASLLPYFHYDLLYGSIGAGVALLSWVYLSSVILLFGAQFTALLHRDHLLKASYKSPHRSADELPVEEVVEKDADAQGRGGTEIREGNLQL
ncbi:MAG TPA: YihY/virulence factor BrkB family protein [Blastocatellia bacterium]|nr:YihY/virulence factor BrkB family protein [Blastocatellia bacterium]